MRQINCYCSPSNFRKRDLNSNFTDQLIVAERSDRILAVLDGDLGALLILRLEHKLSTIQIHFGLVFDVAFVVKQRDESVYG